MLGRVVLRRQPAQGFLTAAGQGRLQQQRAWTCPQQRRRLSGNSSSSSSNELVAADPAKYGAYCVDLVRQYDYDAFLCGLLVPRPSR